MASSRKAFLLRVDPSVLDAVQRWANDDLRSLNGQIEYVLRRALAQAGRASTRAPEVDAPDSAPASDDDGVDGDD